MSESALKPAKQPHGENADIESEHEIELQTSLVERALRNLKHGDAFAVLDSYGDFGTIKDTPEGLFYRDTRFLSHFELRLERKRPMLLSSIVHENKAALSVDLTNPDIQLSKTDKLPRDTIFLERTKFLWHGVCYERIGIRNYDDRRRRLQVEFLFGTDFHDLFEVRGMKRERRGRQESRIVGPDRVEFRYAGLDGVKRRTVLRFTPAPARLDANRAAFIVDLVPQQQISLFVTIACEEEEIIEPCDFFLAYRDTRRARRASTADVATVASSNDLFNEVVCRATSDLYTLITRTEFGPYPFAGIPWYSTEFGRDGIITAMLMLWMDPKVSRGVLRYLAAMQATDFNPEADAQPGKILHERRHGEMARLGEVPFGFYYGTVDATPLFLMLAGMYFERTGDRETLSEIWPNIEAALRWIDEFGDVDGDGFIEYHRQTEHGLANQGWKDSHDSIFHAGGSTAKGPIALCEVQGYVYAAKRSIARIAAAFGRDDLASRLLDQAAQLRRRFEEAFWCEDIGTYALALDGAKRPCRVQSSNAGHALFTGIAAPGRARRVARTLMDSDGFSGWGIRTLALGEARYNPMSYHNGSVWPHDNAMIALGFAHYGLKNEAARVFEGMFTAAIYQELRRLPELFCGFLRRPHRGPTAYPVACAPQAWASAAPFGLLAACLGLELSHQKNQVRFKNPVMPSFLDELVLRDLRIGGSAVDLRLFRLGNDVTVNVLARRGDIRVTLEK